MTEKLNEQKKELFENFFKNEKQKRNLFFVGKFFAIFAALSAIISFADLGVFTSGITFIEAKMLSLPYYENLLLVGNNVFEINNHCTGLLSAAILAAVVFALRKPDLRNKWKIFLVGAAALIPINVIRIAGVLFVGIEFGAEAAELTHTISWFLMTGIIMGLWHYLTVKTVGEKKLEGML